jgi:hypothetical protein
VNSYYDSSTSDLASLECFYPSAGSDNTHFIVLFKKIKFIKAMNRKWVLNSTKFGFILMLTVLCFFITSSSFAQVEMKETGSYFQNFNTLSPSGVNNVWVDNQTLPGWYWQCGTSGQPTTYYSDDGSSTYKGKRCYGTTGDSDRAIGALCSSSINPFGYGVKLHNSSSESITNISVSYTGEQWRVSRDYNLQQIYFYYKITSLSEFSFVGTISTNGWIAVPALYFVSPTKGPSSTFSTNGNDLQNRKIIAEYTIPGITIPSGSYIYFRWNDIPDTKDDYGLAIDDVTIKWTVLESGNINVWNGAQSTDWFDSRNWSKAVVPGADSDVKISAVSNGAVCSDDITIKNLRIVDGGSLTINTGKALTVNEGSIFDGQNCMTLKSPTTLLNSSNDHAASASFLSKGTVSGLGSIKVERYITQYSSATDGWHFFSSPVENTNIDSQFLPSLLDDLYFYWEGTDTWLNQKTTPDITKFENGLGYLVSYSTSTTRTISGLPNNSDINFNNLTYTGYRGWHLLGNPYPCGISWGGSEWGISGFSLFAKLLNSGGTYSDLSIGETIPAMNGFFVKANSAINAIKIPRAARLHSISEGWKQFKASNGKKIKIVINSSSDNTFAETKINLNENATNGFDDLEYDSPYLSGMYGTPLFYSVLSTGQELSTNSVPDAA